MQVTFLRVWSHRTRYDRRWSPNTWLYRIATNLAIDQLRARQSRQRASEPMRLHLRRVADAGSRGDLGRLDGAEVKAILEELAAELERAPAGGLPAARGRGPGVAGGGADPRLQELDGAQSPVRGPPHPAPRAGPALPGVRRPRDRGPRRPLELSGLAGGHRLATRRRRRAARLAGQPRAPGRVRFLPWAGGGDRSDAAAGGGRGTDAGDRRRRHPDDCRHRALAGGLRTAGGAQPAGPARRCWRRRRSSPCWRRRWVCDGSWIASVSPAAAPMAVDALAAARRCAAGRGGAAGRCPRLPVRHRRAPGRPHLR